MLLFNISLPDVLSKRKIGTLPGLPFGSYLKTICLPASFFSCLFRNAILKGSSVEPKHCSVNSWNGYLSKIVISCLSK